MYLEIPMYREVYHSILFKIAVGEYSVGARLPARSELARIFHTSEDTVRKGLLLLAKQGYISMRKGSAPIVILGAGNPQASGQMLKNYQERQAEILAAMNSYRFVIPGFLFKGLSRLNREELLMLFNDLREILTWSADDFDLRAYKVFTWLLGKSGNQNVVYYFERTQIFMRISLMGIQDDGKLNQLKRYRAKILRWLAGRIRLFLTTGEKLGRKQIRLKVEWYVDSTIKLLGLSAETSIVDDKALFVTFEPKYMTLCFRMIEEIFSGKYKRGDFLPSDSVAAKEYHVAVLTARKAYKLLNQIGFAVTVPRVGTQVIFSNRHTVKTPAEMNARPIRIRAFLDCLYFLKIPLREVMFHAFLVPEPLMEDLEALKNKYGQCPTVFQMYYMTSFMDCIARHTENAVYTSYIKLIKPLIFFGAYTLQMEYPAECGVFCDMVHVAVQSLQNGDWEAFVRMIEELLVKLTTWVENVYEGQMEAHGKECG